MKKKIKKINGMVDVSQKSITKRTAVAVATLKMKFTTFNRLIKDGSPKGDVFETARIAGIMAAKSTPTLIPMCHPLELNQVRIEFCKDKKVHSVTVKAEVICLGRTGVEMEAITAANVACLTIYDMMKWAERGMVIVDVKLLKKTGGKSGDYERK